MGRRTRWFAVVMGLLLVALGVAETVRVLRSGDGGLAFWFGTLVGGGALILGSVAVADRAPVASRAMTVFGCLAGMLPTMWTLVIPALLATLVVVRLRNPPRALSPGQDAAPSAALGDADRG